MWRRTVVWIFGVAVVAGATEVDAQVFLGFVDSSKRFAVLGAVEGAAARLSQPSCQAVLADFADESGSDLLTPLIASGRSPADAFTALQFVDHDTAPQCATGKNLAFTQTGSQLIHVCGREFVKRSRRNRKTAEIIVIHEFLHTLGLGENPPTSQAITAQITLRCGG
jgi:hypothetical protein